MSRHVDNLERLLNRLHLCIGPDDELTQQVSKDLQRLRGLESTPCPPVDSTLSYRQFIAKAKRDCDAQIGSLVTH